MADKLTPERRSWNMSRIRGKDTKPELLVRRLLHAKGYRYRLHGKAEFWAAKRNRTRDRDANQRRLLEDAGWQVLTVWECELKDSSALEAELVRFLETGR